MKNFKFIIFLLSFVLFFSLSINAQQYNEYARFEAGNLEIISYSSKWNEEKLNSLYIELLNNFHGDEFDYLSAIYLYPDSPYGVSGYYYDDISVKDGSYLPGRKAYIELFDMDTADTVRKAARTLAHEYGHHYTIYNMLLKEGKYFTQWSDTEYAELRNLSDYNISYSHNSVGNTYRWDATEIMAEDYVQLLGSSTAKLSIDYPDCMEALENNISRGYNSTNSFNLMPQKNLELPLAADVDGLYEYLSGLSGYKTAYPVKSEAAVILSVDENLNELNKKQYTIKWEEASGNGPYEYTVIMYPKSNPMVPVPIKTVKTGEEMSAVFGSVVLNTNAEIKSTNDVYEGDYEFYVFYKDKDGFMYKSGVFEYSFGYEEFVKDDTVGASAENGTDGSFDYSKIVIDDEFEYEDFFNDFYEDFGNKVSFKSHYCDIINYIGKVLS